MEQAIGVIDSGVGGLTVAREMIQQLPDENLIYIGDTQRCPYGSRSREEVRAFTWHMVTFALSKNIKMLVIACNTATAFVLEDIKQQLTIPVIGVIQPGANAAMQVTRNQHIAVIGTQGTVDSESYPQALKRLSKDVQVQTLACPAFVPLVEKGYLTGDETEHIVRTSLAPLADISIDTLILGCTHYPLLENVIQRVVGDHVNVISSGTETAREVSMLLAYQKQLKDSAEPASYTFYATGDVETFTQIAEQWLQLSIDVEKIVLDEVYVL